jgi:hypothetical protein
MQEVFENGLFHPRVETRKMHCDLKNAKNIPEHFNFVENFSFLGLTLCCLLESSQRFCLSCWVSLSNHYVDWPCVSWLPFFRPLDCRESRISNKGSPCSPSAHFCIILCFLDPQVCSENNKSVSSVSRQKTTNCCTSVSIANQVKARCSSSGLKRWKSRDSRSAL